MFPGTSEWLPAMIRGTVLLSAAACVVGALIWALRIRAANLRWRAWFAVLVCGLGFVPLTVRLPWRVVSAPPASNADRVAEVAPPRNVELNTLPEEQESPITDVADDTEFEPIDELDIPATKATLPLPPVAEAASNEPSANPRWPRVLLGVWLGGMIAIFARGVWRYSRFLRSLRHCVAAPGEWADAWRKLRDEARVRRDVPMLVGEHYGPALCRLSRGYALVVPRAMWERTPANARDVILRHELAHYLRNDLTWSLIARWLAAPHWFNPLAHLAVRRLDEASEWACDDAATGGQAERQLLLSKALLELSESSEANGAMQAAASGNVLALRIRRLLEPTLLKERTMKRVLVATASLLCLIAAGVRFELAAQEAKPFVEAATKPEVATPSAETAPAYVIEPPDVLLIDSVKLVPNAPHMLEPLDTFFIQGTGLLPEEPLAGQFALEPGGRVSLGAVYGALSLNGLTLEEAQQAIAEHLQKTVGIRSPEIGVRLVASAGAQLISGEHLVGPDGNVNLGSYGSVGVAGKTIQEAREAIEAHLLEQVDEVKMSVDVFKYNSKFCYIILEDDASGDQVVKLPLNGNEAVLDAFALATENTDVRIGPRTEVWIARAGNNGSDQILRVELRKIMRGDASATNWRLRPNDRLVISQPLKK